MKLSVPGMVCPTIGAAEPRRRNSPSRQNPLAEVRALPVLTLLGFLLALGFKAAASGPGDEHWDNQFGVPGANATLYGIAVSSNHVYVAGGSVTAAGNTKANAVAAFDGTNWLPLNGGLLDLPVVIGLGLDGQYLYVGGIFTNADDPTAVDAARWDGTSWAGIGVSGAPYVFKRHGGNLYVGGVMTSAGGVAATNIARWDGTNWYALGPGLSGPPTQVSGVVCLAFQGNNVYAGGTFNAAGALAVTNIAYYDGNAWHAMGNSFNGAVIGLAFYGPYLYAGGAFTNVSLGLTNLACWDGSQWLAAPGGGANKQVEDFATDGTNLFVGGWFTQIGGITATGVVSFDGNVWSPLQSGVHAFQGNAGQVNRMSWQSNQLYVAGSFESAGAVGAQNVARWDGATWWSLGGAASKGMPSSLLNRVYSLFSFNGPGLIPTGVYAGGVFGEAGDVVVNGLARWDGASWNPVGGGITGLPGTSLSIRAMATDGGNLYAAGFFTNAGGIDASSIAYWDGNTWNPMGTGLDWLANSLALDNANYLYVGGGFTNAGGIYSRGFAVWAYGSWYNLGNVEGTNGAVYSIAYDGATKVYIGGSFFSAGGVAATNVAYFDNSAFTWHPVGSGFNAKINALAYGNGILYAGGSFTKAGNLTVNHIAQWDGTNWSGLGSGITGGSTVIVNAMVVAGTNLYVTGNFTNAGGVNITNIARWNGSTWSALGSGLDTPRAGFALAASGDELFVGGNFTSAGDKPSQFFAHWNPATNYYPAANMELTRSAWNANHQFRFRVIGTSGQSYIIQASTNLTSWAGLQTNSAMFYDFTDTNAGGFGRRFYRTKLGP